MLRMLDVKMPKYFLKKLLYLSAIYVLCQSLHVRAYQDQLSLRSVIPFEGGNKILLENENDGPYENHYSVPYDNDKGVAPEEKTELVAEDLKKVAFKEVICKSVTIRTIKDFNKLKNCTIVVGYVRIVEMDFSPRALKEVESSNIEEISGYLLVYHVTGLDSLERLFPKLIIIRGAELLYDEYALVVLENRDLKNIGLVSLLRVLKGSIRIEHNPSLCFVTTINWVQILGNETKRYYYDLNNNKPPNQCPLCYTYQDELEVKEVNRHKKCWSYGRFQKTSLDFVGGQECPQKEEKIKCLTSCSNTDCRHCMNYVSNRGCVDNCLPPIYRLAFKRQCVANCTELSLVQLGIECVEKCPKHYQEVRVNGVTTCALNCSGNFVIHSTKDLEGLHECTKINGSLTIEIHETDKPIVQNLENAFRNLNEIIGYLKIINSPQIVSLHMFKNLHTIQGSQLLENRYSLYVVNNHYLQELFLTNVIMIHGCVYFHLNPRLCYDKITSLQKGFKDCMGITITDASTNSNGERVVCGEDLRASNATVKDVNSDSALIEVSALKSSELLLLIGYIYYYKEAPFKNVTKYDGRHGCGRDGWYTDVVLKVHRRHILRNLRPGTQYAYFVNSMTFMDYPYDAEHVSEIQYFQTLPSKPEMVAKLFYHSLSLTEIEIHWWPPRVTNGVLKKYILEYEEANTTMANNKQNVSETCKCPKLDSESLVPTPHVESYYNKEQLLYRDSVMNFIYVKKQPTENETKASRVKRYAEEHAAESFLENADQFIAVSRLKRNATQRQGFNFEEFFKKLEREALMTQDEEIESYVISHPYPVCDQFNPKVQDQLENKCVPLERFEGAIEIPGDRHSYILKNLEPEKTYRVSLRACVKDLLNGCGAEKVVFAETVSKRLETIIQNLAFKKL